MKYVILGIALSLLGSFMASAQDAKMKNSALYTYKCHLQLQDKREVIRDYRQQPKNQNGNLESMLKTEIVVVEKGERLAITDVFQCVEIDSEFSKAKSRELDRLTLR